MKKTDETKARRSFLTNWRQFYRALSGKTQTEEYDPMDHAMEEMRFEETLEPLPEAEGGFEAPADATGYAQQPGAFAYGAQPYGQEAQPGYPTDAAQQPGLYPQAAGYPQPQEFGAPPPYGQGGVPHVHFSDGAAVVAGMEADPMRGFVSPAEHIYGASLAGDGMSEVYDMRQMQPPVDPAIADLMQDENAQGNMDEWLERTFPESEETTRWVEGQPEPPLEYDKTQPFSALLDVLATNEEVPANGAAQAPEAEAASIEAPAARPQEFRMEIPRAYAPPEPMEPPEVHVAPVSATAPPVDEVVFAMDGSDADALVIAMGGYDAEAAIDRAEFLGADAGDSADGTRANAEQADSAPAGDAAARFVEREEPVLAAEETLPGLMAMGETDIDPDMDAARAEETAREEGRLPFLSEYALTAFADQAKAVEADEADEVVAEPIGDLMSENTVPPSETWLEVPKFGEAKPLQAEPEEDRGPARIAETIRLAQEARNAERDDTPLPVEEQSQAAYYPDIDTIYGEPQDAWGTGLDLGSGAPEAEYTPLDGLRSLDAAPLVDVGYALERTQELGMQDEDAMPLPMEAQLERGYESVALGEETRGVDVSAWNPTLGAPGGAVRGNAGMDPGMGSRVNPEAYPQGYPQADLGAYSQGSQGAAQAGSQAYAQDPGYPQAGLEADSRIRPEQERQIPGDLALAHAEAASTMEATVETAYADEAAAFAGAAMFMEAMAQARAVGGVDAGADGAALETADAKAPDAVAAAKAEDAADFARMADAVDAASRANATDAADRVGETCAESRAAGVDVTEPIGMADGTRPMESVDASFHMASDAAEPAGRIPETDETDPDAGGRTFKFMVPDLAQAAEDVSAMAPDDDEGLQDGEATQADEGIPMEPLEIDAAESTDAAETIEPVRDEPQSTDAGLFGALSKALETARIAAEDTKQALAAIHEQEAAPIAETVRDAERAPIVPDRAHEADRAHVSEWDQAESNVAERMIAVDIGSATGSASAAAEDAAQAADAAPAAHAAEAVEIPIWEMRGAYAQDAQPSDESAREPGPAPMQAVSIDELVLPVALDVPTGEAATLLDDMEIDGVEAATGPSISREDVGMSGDWALSAGIGFAASVEEGAASTGKESPASAGVDAGMSMEGEAASAISAPAAPLPASDGDRSTVSGPVLVEWADAVAAPIPLVTHSPSEAQTGARSQAWDQEPARETGGAGQNQAQPEVEAVPQTILGAASEPQTIEPWAFAAEAQAPSEATAQPRAFTVTPVWDRAVESGYSHIVSEPEAYDRRTIELPPHVPGADRIPGATAAVPVAPGDLPGDAADAAQADAADAAPKDAREQPEPPIQVVDLEALLSRFNI